MAVLRVLIWIAGTFVILVLAVLLYLSFADLSWLKPRIESAFEGATGRQLSLDGTFDLAIVPEPMLLLEDVSLSNAKWSSEPLMARIGHASVRLNLWSLFSGPVRVKELHLRDIDVLLEKNAQDQGNWVLTQEHETGTSTPPEVEGGGNVPVLIEFAELRVLRLTYRAPGTEPLVASLAALDIRTDEAQYTVLDGEGTVDDLPLHLAGKFGPAQTLAAGRGIGIELSGSLDQVDIELDGTIGDLARGTDIDLKAVASSDDIAPILKHLAVDLPLSGAFHLETSAAMTQSSTQIALDTSVGEIAGHMEAALQMDEVSFSAKVPALDKVGSAFDLPGLPAEDLAVEGRMVMTQQAYNLEGVTAQVGEARFQLDGSVAREGRTAELALTAKGPTLTTLGPELPAMPFVVGSKVNLSPEGLELDPIEATFGQSDLAGSIKVAMKKKTAITGRFKSKSLDLTPFAGDGDKSEKAGETTDEAGFETKQAKEERQYIFVEDPLPFEQLNKMDVDINADIGRFKLNQTVLLDVSTALDLKGGKLQLVNRFRGPEGGRSSNNIILTTASQSADLAVKVAMRDMRLNLFSGDVADPTLVPPVSVTLDFRSNGDSPRALAASTTGRVLVTQGKGQIENNLVNKVSGDIFAQLFKALNPFAKEDKFTTLDCTIVGLDITKGKAEITGLYSQGKKIKIKGGGDIDLNTEAIYVEFNTQPREGIGVSADMFVTPFVKLVGTLANPSVGLDSKGTLFAGAAVATGGIALVAKAAVDRAAGELDQCEEVLSKVGDHPPMPN